MTAVMLATVFIAVVGHFTILALVRHLDPHKALRTYWLALAAGSLVLAASGCGSSLGFGGPSKARPNRPGWVMGEFHTQDPVTGERRYVSLTGQGSENSDTPMVATATKDGVTFNSGTSAPFEGWGSMWSNGTSLWGCIIFAFGVALLVLSKFPIASFVIPPIAGWVALGSGVGLIALPFVAEALKPVITVGGFVLLLGVVVYYGSKLKWFEKATDTDAVMDRIDKGDLAGAATMHYLHRKGDLLGRMKARAVKRNDVTAALVEGAAPIQPVATPTPPEG